MHKRTSLLLSLGAITGAYGAFAACLGGPDVEKLNKFDGAAIAISQMAASKDWATGKVRASAMTTQASQAIVTIDHVRSDRRRGHGDLEQFDVSQAEYAALPHFNDLTDPEWKRAVAERKAELLSVQCHGSRAKPPKAKIFAGGFSCG